MAVRVRPSLSSCGPLSLFLSHSAVLERPLTSPTLLHLVQPFALQKFSTMVTHIKQYRAYLGSLSAKGQNAQIARDILIDVVDNSGIDFGALETLLKSFLPAVQALDSNYMIIS
jgi:hypothetical protein